MGKTLKHLNDKIMKPFKYLFYRLYQLMIKVGNGDVAEYYAILLMTMLIMMNVYSITSLVYVFGRKVNLGLNSVTSILLIVATLVITFYFSFVYKKKFITIVKSYEVGSDKKKMAGNIFAISYFILSIGLMIFCFYLMIKKNRGEL
jgi:hypothetical protein